VVGFGAGAELGGGAGAGAELGGASVGDGAELREPDPPPELDELEVLGEPDEREPPAEGVAAWPARAVGWTPGAAARPLLWCRWLAEGVGVPADDVGVDSCVPEAAVDWSAVWVGAVRANKVAKPTAVTALSCVARQVRRDNRRSPAERAAPGCSSARTGAGRVAAGDSRYGSPVLWVR
jgi:hypothetical protein